MKKIFIFIAVVLLSLNAFAQRIGKTYAEPVTIADIKTRSVTGANPSARTTAVGDTIVLENSPGTTSFDAYRMGYDSGYVYGTNYWNDLAFAERYDVSDSGVNMQVVGVMAVFDGNVKSVSSQSITFYVWDQGPVQPISGSLLYNGFPNNILDSLVVPVNELGIGLNLGPDTMKRHFFPSGTGNISTSFFIGYGMSYNYLSGIDDTIGLISTHNGVRGPGPLYSLSLNIAAFGDTTLDTIINVQNATFGADNIWYDNYTRYDSLYNNLLIYPILISGFPTNTKSITRNNLSFYGNYPNPADNITNVKFSLAATDDITLQLMDMNGKTLSTIRQSHLAAGEHTTVVNTSGLPSGDYLYLIRTSNGDGIAGKLSVKH